MQPSDASPHHLAFVADPQLVDPHTYPGRPWPLSSLTVSFTDKYLKRSYKTLQRRFDPDTVYFLGDLFDGGREWSTGGTFHHAEERWKKWGMGYWLKEYERFARIFFTSKQIAGGAAERRNKQIIASLPGNHDLGFATGVQTVVRGRFQAFFGPGDRVDVIGNHTFVGLDTVSLSAKVVQGSAPEIWTASNDFLDNVRRVKKVKTELLLGRAPQQRKFHHSRVEPTESNLLPKTQADADDNDDLKELPTVLLTHVPLYREPGTKCGYGREKYPPADDNAEFEERNAIRVAGGYQYQNVLNKDLTKTIAEKVGNVDYAFSGDDHDYCEVTHRAYPSAGRGIKEITVKSLSWAMGISRPGFVLASLWNPIEANAKPIPGSPGSLRRPTLHTQLCLLPNQLAVFVQYGFYAILTLLVLLIRSAARTLTERAQELQAADRSYSVLPMDEPSKRRAENGETYGHHGAAGSGTSEGNAFLAPRSVNARARSVSPAEVGGGYGLPMNGAPVTEHAGYRGSDKKDVGGYLHDNPRRRMGFALQWALQFRHDVFYVALPSFVWFFWLWHKF